MKTNHLSWLIVLTLTFFSFSIVSCSDNDEKEDEDNKQSIIGTWAYSESNSKYVINYALTFWVDGTGNLVITYNYIDDNASISTKKTFNWFFDEEKKIIRLLIDNEVKTYKVDRITSNKLVLDGTVYTKK